ncbi:MAG: T9SS type A sorting domain-containing protein [Crocinitomicaceae bacterium]|nr:T9SS type A sorting domain-containing protein [Crocinitomicaceae bacterium]
MMGFNKSILCLLVSIAYSIQCYSQNLKWSAFIDTSTTFSSPRCTDLNGDNVLDIVIGGGLDGSPENNGINAINGLDGSVLWNFPVEEEIFGSAQLMDITGDNIDDIFIGGRYAEFYAIDGSTGNQIWEFFPYSPPVAMDSGWFNFYTAQFVPDQNSDGIPDLLVANGGNHSAPAWDTLREPGMLIVLDAMTGAVLAKDTMPDGEETYCSAVVVQYGATLHIIYGSGGENEGGALWRVPLSELMNNDISNSVMLVQDQNLGFIAPSSIADMNGDGIMDIINQAYNGTLRCFDGSNNNLMWEVQTPGTESSSAPTIGNFIGDNTPDVFNVLFKGTAPSFTDFYQIMIDGATGNIEFKDSIGSMHYGSSSAVDLDLNGRDEILMSINNHNGSFISHQLMTIDFQNDIISPFYLEEAGVNLASTPLIEDIDGNGFLDFVFAYRADSINPMGANGFYVKCVEGTNTEPGVGIAWGSYMGTNWDGHYNYEGSNCGSFSVSSVIQNITCNQFADGAVKVTPFGGVAPFTYLWNTGEITDSIGGLDVGSYDIIVTDSTGCYTTLAYTMYDPYTISFGGIMAPNCPGDSNAQAILNSSGCPCMFSTCIFDWVSGDSTKTASNLVAGWNVVTITHMDGCIVVDSVLVPETYPVMDSMTYSDIMCTTDPYASSFIELHLHDSLNTLVSWSTGGTIPYIDSLNTGVYYYHLLDDRGCIYNDSVIINAPDTLISNYTVVDLSCFGDSSGVISATSNGGFNPYLYSWSNGSFGSVNNGLHAGTYDLIVTDSAGCEFVENGILVSEPYQLALSITDVWHDSTGLCTGGATILVTGGIPNYNYQWNDPGLTTNDTITDLCDGVFTITITDLNGCQVIDSITIMNSVGIDILNSETLILIYPNPASNSILFQAAKNLMGFNFSINDTHGRSVFKGSISQLEMQIDISYLEAGMYYFIVEGEESNGIKIIKE